MKRFCLQLLCLTFWLCPAWAQEEPPSSGNSSTAATESVERAQLGFPFDVKPGMSRRDVEQLLKAKPMRVNPGFESYGVLPSARWKVPGKIVLKQFAPTDAIIFFKSKKGAAKVNLLQDGISSCDDLRSAFADAAEFVTTTYAVVPKPVEDNDPVRATAASWNCLTGNRRLAWINQDGSNRIELMGLDSTDQIAGQFYICLSYSSEKVGTRGANMGRAAHHKKHPLRN